MKYLLVLFLLLLSACTAPLPTPPPITAPTIWRVQSTPTLSWLTTRLTACAKQQPTANLVYLERPAPSLDLSTAEIVLRWGAPANLTAPAVILGSEELVFITHPSNPISQLSTADLRAILSGKLTTWDKLQPTAAKETLKVYLYAPAEDIQLILESALPNLPTNRETAWLAPDPAAVRQAVASSPHAFGYLPRRWLDASVKTIPITDLPAQSLRQPLLGISGTTPSEAQKTFLQCLAEAAR